MDRSNLTDEVIDPLIGTMIGRYRIEKAIGQGGMGAVYELLQPAIHKRMALKLLHEQYADRREIVQRFFDEARAVNLIGHPSIVDITDFSHLPDGRPFIIMEYLQGESLEDYLDENGPLEESEVLEILKQICSALGAAHAKGIVHRDLKPENIFLVRDPHQAMRVKVLDFGIAKLKDNSTLDAVNQTQTGVVLGTPTYMSPEQAQGNTLAADHRTDIYSLGVMLFQMLAGAPPFSGQTFASLIFKHISEEPPKLSDTQSQAAPAWSAIVAKALAKAPDDRYQSMAALLEDAKAALPATTARAATGVGSESASIAVEAPGKRSPLLPIVVALFIAGAAAAWWVSRDTEKGEMSASAGGPDLIEASAAATTAPGALDATPKSEQFDPPSTSSDASTSKEPNAIPTDAGTANLEAAKPRDNKSKVRGKGQLRVIADPWAHVYLDGKRVGQTPLNVTIGAGKHKVRLRNDATGATKSTRFTLKRGGSHVIRESW